MKQLVQREQISMLPPSLVLLRKVETEFAAIEKLYDEVTVRHRVAALNVEIAKVENVRIWHKAESLGTAITLAAIPLYKRPTEHLKARTGLDP